ncbi:MAG: hypothetical protein HQM08_27350 [Candidatus Riflebacteria bacterium]|nr:hypothetical protein [Candidatus Riflebacteria bacterium]
MRPERKWYARERLNDAEIKLFSLSEILMSDELGATVNISSLQTILRVIFESVKNDLDFAKEQLQ